MSNKLEIQIGISPCEETPVDNYIQELVAAGAQNPWIFLPDGAAGHPCFYFEDSARKLTTMLVCEADAAEHYQHRLEATNAAGETEMRSVEWIAAGHSGPLHTLYAILSQAQQDTQMAVNDDTDIDLDDDVTLTNQFIDALLQDVQGKRHDIHFERCGDTFIASSFGCSESTITVTKECENHESGRFLMKVVKPDGTLVLSCAETSKHSDDEAELRMLYRLLDETIPIEDIDEATTDVQRFVENKVFDKYFDRVLDGAVPPIERASTGNAVLIYDIFEGVSEPSVIRQFLDEIAIRHGPLAEPRYEKLKTLAAAVFDIMRNVKREPNGKTFTERTVTGSYATACPASQVCFASSVARIANSYTIWHTIYGTDPAIGEGRAMTKTAVLLLAAILSDQLP